MIKFPFVLRKKYDEVVYKLECLLCYASGNAYSNSAYPLEDMYRMVDDYIERHIDIDRCMQSAKKEILNMNVKLERGAIMPTRAHEADAGLDLYAKDGQIVPAKESAIFDTGVHIQIPAGMAGLLVSKSGLNVNHELTSTGLIDEEYTGSIKVKLYNHGGYDYRVEAGDKISQLVILPCCKPELEVVNDMKKTERGDGGFGSTGR